MSSTGYWFVGTAAPETVDLLRTTVPATDFASVPDGADLTWWQSMDQATVLAPADLRYTFPSPSDAAQRFIDTLDALRPDPTALDTCLRALSETSKQELFHVAVRKGDPVAALYYGLGFDDARLLPGRFGCFLLTADDVDSSLTALEHLPERPHIGRGRFATRATEWNAAAADEPALDPYTLLDEPLRILRLARRQRVGVIGLMQWF